MVPRFRLLATSALIAVAAGVFGAAASPAAAVPKNFYGIIPGGKLTDLDYAVMQAGKVRTARFFLSWPEVEPTPTARHWPDALVAELAQHGIQAEPQLTGSPQWATGSSDNRTPPLKGKALAGWKGFVTQAVNRYKPGGTFWRQNPDIPAHPVRDWQIWNEPNLNKEWPPDSSAKTYGKLVKVTDKVIHEADPNATVVLAGLSGTDRKGPLVNYKTFLKKLYKVRKIKKHFDAVGFHPYSPTVKSLKEKLETVRKLMKRGHDKKTPLWITEIGYGSGPKDRFGINQGSPQGQAKMLNRVYKLVAKHRKQWKIRKLDWYDWRDPASPDDRHFCSFCPYAGLLRPNYTAKPAFNVFRSFTGAGPVATSGNAGLLSLLGATPAQP